MHAKAPPVLSPELQRSLKRVGEALAAERDVAGELATVVDGLNALPPAHLARAEREIFEAAMLYHAPWGTLERLARRRLDARRRLACFPGLQYVYLFHRDGHLREAALDAVAGGLPSAFLFAAVAARLNDWVPQVRAAAADCAARNLRATDAAIIAEAGLALLPRESTWTRWGNERAVLASAFDRADVAALLAEAVILRPTGPMAQVLRFALRSDRLDPHLERISRQAAQPAVRALAARALADGHAIWPEGRERRWIDRSMGVWRDEPALKRRPLADPPPREATIRAAARDRSAVVRKIALDALLRGDYRGPLGIEVATMLAADCSRGVRERAGFILAKCQGAGG